MSRTDSASSRSHAPARQPMARPFRYPGRGFGMGYGNSSGYAAARRYVPGGEPPARFRLA